MSREILFIGKRIDSGEWVYGVPFFINSEEKAFIINNCSTLSFDKNTSFNGVEVDCKTIGQYTGLKDKNGVKIFEGDIVECVIGLKYAVVFSSYANFGLKPFYSNVKNIECQSIDNIYAETSLLVIGNIHDK